MRTTRIATLLIGFTLVVAACGGDDSGTTTTLQDVDNSETQTTPAVETTTTAAPETTATAAPPETTTTTVVETTTTSAPVASEDAEATVMAKTAAALAAVPEGWMTEITPGFEIDTGTDDVFSACTDGQFDVVELDSFTVAASTLMADGPPPAGSFFPGGNASIEARVFESSDVAAEAFSVLETVFGTEEGRQCVADEFLVEMTADLPAEEAEVAFSLDEIEVPGADVAIAVNMSLDVEGIGFGFTVELAASLDGDCTVYAVFLGFGEPVDPEVRDTLFAAAAGV